METSNIIYLRRIEEHRQRQRELQQKEATLATKRFQPDAENQALTNFLEIAET